MKNELYIFGSAIRGEVGPNSDIDVLVVMKNEDNRSEYPAEWSCYQEKSLYGYYKEGRLFAWHLYLESVCIFTNENIPVLKSWGEPSPYVSALEDICDLENLLKSCMSEIEKGSPSLIYELGLIYTSLRDIAMSASWYALDKPCFSSNAPYYLDVNMPLDMVDYEIMKMARHKSTRGVRNESDFDGVVNRLNRDGILDWVSQVKELI